jgi:hypothetical protein
MQSSIEITVDSCRAPIRSSLGLFRETKDPFANDVALHFGRSGIDGVGPTEEKGVLKIVVRVALREQYGASHPQEIGGELAQGLMPR